MKKFIFLMGAIYLLSLISFKEPKEKQESFSEMIKKDPTRIRELLHVADSINQNNRDTTISPDDEIDEAELAILRKKNRIKIGKNWPRFIVAKSDVQTIIGTNPQPTDSLIFYLGTYKESKDYPQGRNSSKTRLARYNQRNAKNQPPNTKYQLKDLLGRPTILIQEYNSKKFAAKSYDVGRICPPPPPSGGGCD